VPFNSSERDGFVIVRNVRAISDGLALVCEFGDGRRVGVPTHAIAAWSDVRMPRDYGTLAIKREVAEHMGLLRGVRAS
jgi:hypothetical protein